MRVRPPRLNIGPRLILGFAIIILAMLLADAVVLWQFHVVQSRAGRLNDIDQGLIAVLRVRSGILAFHDRLNALANAEDANRLVTDTGPLSSAVLEDIDRAKNAVRQLPFDVQPDPTVLPTLEVLRASLPSQLRAIGELAHVGDWRAVRLRLENQVRPLEALTSGLVENVQNGVSQERADAVVDMARAQERVLFIVPVTALLTLLIAATLGLALTRSVTRPLELLLEGSKALARGEFQHRVGISGNDELAHLGRVFDDTAQRLRELYASLHSSEDRLRLVIDTIPAHVWSALPDGSVDFINKRWQDSTGLPLESALGWDWRSILHPEDLPRYVKAWNTAVAGGAPMESEARLRRPGGEYRWWLIRNVPLRDESGNIVKWYGTAVDVTERKQAEEALRQARADLAHVNRVTTMGELTASLAHEVKQPLTAAVISANACVRWLAHDPPDIAEARAAAMRIVAEGQRATDVIGRIRLLFTKGVPQREAVDMNDLVREMIVLLRSEAIRFHISVDAVLAAGLPPVMGDRVQLQQVLMNLIVNGIDAMKSVAGTRDLAITSRRADGGQVLVTVTDTGVGLPSLGAEDIFKAFVTTKEHGIGMGLSISRSIVESHGGRLWAVDRAPVGASFCLTLPASEADTSAGGVMSNSLEQGVNDEADREHLSSTCRNPSKENKR